MLSELSENDLFITFCKDSIAIYKDGAVRQETLKKYLLALG